jgi:2-dehydro-3-deoxyphosphooctonate aldolase (KDO 8-P synthase)
MKQTEYPVILGDMHGVQISGDHRSCSSENRKFVLPLSKAVITIGLAALFLEVYENPDKTLPDSSNCIDLKYFKQTKYKKVIGNLV